MKIYIFLFIQYFLLVINFFGTKHATPNNSRPNIILIIADDLGWNDVSFHGSNEIPTPNIDALAYNGIILNSHYTQQLCSPSRASLLTGKYPIRNGMQHSVILEPEPRGLPLNEKLLPEYLKEVGYATHAVGKWHLGYFKKQYTPTFRGFDTHYGYWNGFQSYYDHQVIETLGDFEGLDMRRNLKIDNKTVGQYSTDLFTEEAIQIIEKHNRKNPLFLYLAHLASHTGGRKKPLEAPDEEIAKFSYIKDPHRRVYAAIVSRMDNSIGKVVAALRKKRLLANSIIIFLSDNGAPPLIDMHPNHGSNYPLRGFKGNFWEGGIRTVAAIWSPFLKQTQRVSNNLMHISDWLPTICSAAGISPANFKHLDGIDMWDSLKMNLSSPRLEILHNIDDLSNIQSMRYKEWKFLNGSSEVEYYDEYFNSDINNTINFDVNLILQSEVEKTINGFITQKQIEENSNENIEYEILTMEKILKLRDEATIKCNTKNETPAPTLCDPKVAPCLYNINLDPCEINNVAGQNQDLIQEITKKIIEYQKTSVPPANKPRDPNADPKKFKNVWVPWQDEIFDEKNIFETNLLLFSLVTVGVVLFILLIFGILIQSFRKRAKARRLISINSTPREVSPNRRYN